MTDSLKAIADSVANNIDWVQECAYRQAMLIERIDVWMEFVKWTFWLGFGGLVIYWVLDAIFANRKSNTISGA